MVLLWWYICCSLSVVYLLFVKCVYLCVMVNLLGPGVGGDYGPYRQSERNSLYKQYAQNLHQSGHVYRCFCSNEVCFGTCFM